MALAELVTASVAPAATGRPQDRDLDLFGLTHPGKVRSENQDHFLLATVHPQLLVHGSNLPASENLALRGERLATILLVADGVGGGIAGAEASRLAAETVTRYVSSTLRCCHALDDDGGAFLTALQSAALEAHLAVRGAAASQIPAGEESAAYRMATTLTLAIAIWPWAYVVQVGDSRCYYFGDGGLRQVTRDQTVAQDLVDAGALDPEDLASSPLSSVLSSAIGGGEAVPVVTRLDIRRRGCVLLLCSDGLTAHVTDEEIAEQLRGMRSSEQLCRSLLDLALERGGTDNITVLAGRAVGGSG